MPQQTIDPVVIAARFVIDVQSMISAKRIRPNSAWSPSARSMAVRPGASFPTMHLVLGPIRTFKPEVRAKMLAGIERTAKAAAAMSDAPAPDIKITEGAKAVMNDPGVVATAEKALKAAFGDKLRPSPPGTPSEDFSEFANAGVPSMMFNIGVYEPERVGRGTTTDADRHCRPIIRRCSRRCRSRPSQTGVDGHDARRAQRLRSACPGQMRADPGTGQKPPRAEVRQTWRMRF